MPGARTNYVGFEHFQSGALSRAKSISDTFGADGVSSHSMPPRSAVHMSPPALAEVLHAKEVFNRGARKVYGHAQVLRTSL